MAAIAKLITYDGGLAFSDSVLKIQKREEERGRLIPLERIAGIEVDEPLLGDDGCVRIQIIGKRPSPQNTIYFDEDQYGDALNFKAAFDSFIAQTGPALPPLEMFQPTAIAHRPQREQARYAKQEIPRRPVRQTGRKRRFRWWYALLALLLVGIIASPSKEEDKPEPQQEISALVTDTPTSTPGLTATQNTITAPILEATPFVGYTSPPLVTEPPVATQAPVQTETLVWIPTNGGEKYHRTSGCSNMVNPQQVTLSEAQARGFTACKRCY